MNKDEKCREFEGKFNSKICGFFARGRSSRELSGFLSDLLELVKQDKQESVDYLVHRINCNTLISELYGWPNLLELAKEETYDLYGLKENK